MKKGYIIATFSIGGISVDWKQVMFHRDTLVWIAFWEKTIPGERPNVKTMNCNIPAHLFVVCILSCCLMLTGSACSLFSDSHSQKEGMMRSLSKGDNETVLHEIEEKLSQTSLTGSVVGSGDELMWRLEAGSMNFHVGEFQKSIDQFSTAERLIEEYDERATVSVRDMSAETAGSLTNLNALPYRGFCRDRIALSIFKSLAYLGTGNESAFGAQLRRLRDAQKKVQEDYHTFFEQEKKEIEAVRQSNSAAAERISASEQNSTEQTGDSEFSEELQNVKQAANRGYADFLNPAAIFLSGLGSMRDGNYSNASIDFKRLYEAMPENEMFRRYYATSLRMSGSPVPSELQQVQSFKFPLDRNCVYVIFANGRSGDFHQITATFPVMTAWPVCKFYDVPFSAALISAGGRQYRTNLLADMDGIIAREYQERLPGMITRIAINTLVKEGAFHTGLIMVAVTNMNSTAKALALSSILIGGTFYRSLMNTADTRSWEILPKEFQLTQFPMPSDRIITIEFEGSSSQSKTLQLPQDCRSAIVYVSAPSARNIQYHILPLKIQ